jgi:hypothetical protein
MRLFKTLSKAAIFLSALGLAGAMLSPVPAQAQVCPGGYYYIAGYGCAPLGYYYAPTIITPGFGFYFGGRGWHGGGGHGGHSNAGHRGGGHHH